MALIGTEPERSLPVSAEAYLPAGRQSIAAQCAAAEHCEGCRSVRRTTKGRLSGGRDCPKRICPTGLRPGRPRVVHRTQPA